MANSGGMGKPGINNDWVFVGLAAVGKSHKDLAEILNVHASQVTRLKKNDRDLGYDEGTTIKAWFKGLNYVPPQKGHEDNEVSTKSPHTSGQVAHAEVTKEAAPMSDGELLRFMRALIQDNQHLRDKLRQIEEQPATTTKKGRRKGPR